MQPNAPSLFGLRLMMGRGGRVSLRQGAGAPGWMLALVFSLLLSPLLSRMHQVVHPGDGVAVTAQALSGQEAAQTQTQTQTQAQASAERSLLERLFGAHTEGSPACQLLDHSSAADGALPDSQVALLDLPLRLVLGQSKPSCASGPVAFFQARGPPEFL